MSQVRVTYCISLLAVLLSCNNNVKESKSDNPIANAIDSAAGTISEEVKIDTLCVSERFLNLVKRLDSLGYTNDSNRYNQIYAIAPEYPRALKYRNCKGYLFYTIPFKETIPYFFNDMKTYGTLRFRNDTSDDWKLNIKKFERVESIVGYFFTSKKPAIYKNLKFITDGILEEWKFGNSDEAIQMAEELGKNESFVYFNRGAYICSIENNVYVFHSRSVSFYTEIKGFFDWFVGKFDGKIPNNGKLREGY